VAAQVRSDAPVVLGKMIQLVDPLQGMAASALNEKQDLPIMVWARIDHTQVHRRIGLDLYPDPIRIEFAHWLLIETSLTASLGRTVGDLVPAFEFALHSIYQMRAVVFIRPGR
jgi:hypothetical protein